MEISKEEIKKLAGLSRLELSEAEAEKITKDASEIVAFFDDIKGVETDGDLQRDSFNVSESVADRQREDVGTGKEAEQFREKERNMLKVPGVFDR